MRKKKNKSKILLASISSCTGCSACVSVCPRQCITMREDKEGFIQPYINTSQCIECHKCEKTCPILNPETIDDSYETKAFAAINKDEEVREQSSSGGVFYALAEWVINQGGVVFGARWNDKWEVVHDYAEDIEGVKAFMKSKYVQSIVGDTLLQTKKFLEDGRWVLYSGTPCQLGGLRAYLGKKYEKLIQVDIICHGVPSPGVWRSYLKDYYKNEQILNINFRDKKDGWLGFNVVTTTNNRIIYEKQMENPYFRYFLTNVYLRESCYDCKYRSYHRLSDITLADFWGVDKLCKEIFDNKGTSIVFVHSTMGEYVLDNMATHFYRKLQTRENAICGNPSMDQNYSIPKDRGSFFVFFHFFGFRKTEFCLGMSNTIFRIVHRIRKKINKLLK